MSSISENKGIVKQGANLTPSQKWTSKKFEAEMVAKRMMRFPSLRARAARMQQCGDIVLMQYCPKCGKQHAFSGNLCRDRMCPICGWRLSLSRYSQMLACLDMLNTSLSENDIRCSMLTLTLRNCTIDKLHDTLVSMSRAWHLLSKQAYFKRAVFAWARSIEITYNVKKKTYHPHMHILLFGYGAALSDDFEFTNQAIQAWKKALGIDYNPIYNHKAAYTRHTDEYGAHSWNDDAVLAMVDTSDTLSWKDQCAAATRAAALECSKYIMGDKMGLKIPPSDLLEFSEAIKGIRMVGYGGALKIARQGLGLVDDSIDTTTVHNECSACGAALQNYILRWSGCGYISAPYDEEIGGNENV